jgi:hypothetical protein
MADLGEDIYAAPSTDPEGDFERFLHEQGLELRGPLKADARIHRCATVNKSRDKNGAYLYDPSGPWGWCQDWQADDKPHLWFADGVEILDRYAPVDAQRAAYEVEREAMQDEAARNAQKRWEGASAPLIVGRSGTYLEAKGLSGWHGARREGSGTVLVPMYDNDTLELVNIQSIAPDGEKRFMKGAQTAGCSFAVGAHIGLTDKILSRKALPRRRAYTRLRGARSLWCSRLAICPPRSDGLRGACGTAQRSLFAVTMMSAGARRLTLAGVALLHSRRPAKTSTSCDCVCHGG